MLFIVAQTHLEANRLNVTRVGLQDTWHTAFNRKEPLLRILSNAITVTDLDTCQENVHQETVMLEEGKEKHAEEEVVLQVVGSKVCMRLRSMTLTNTPKNSPLFHLIH